MKNRLLLTVTIQVIFIFSACVEHEFDPPFMVDCSNAGEISYLNQVQGIISTKCAIPGCHNGSTSLPNWTVLSNLQEKQSEIKRRITLPLTDPQKMPREGSINEAERQAIYCWIEQGAQNN